MPGFVDRLLGRKASQTNRVIVGALMGAKDPVHTPREYKRLAERGYEWNTWVYACVNEVSRTCKGIPWIVYQGRGTVGLRTARQIKSGAYGANAQARIAKAVKEGQLVPVDNHPLVKLLTRPNPEMGGGMFWENYFGYWQLSGNSYVEAVRVNNRPPVELWPLRPDRMEVMPNAKNRIGGYVYTAGGGKVNFQVGEVLHSKFFHPTNDWYGLSPIEAAARAIDRDNAAEAWNTALLQNGARPSGALVTEGELTPQQKTDLKEAIDERSRPEAAGRALLLEGGLSWQEMGLTPRDMDWINAQKWGLKRIAAAFGVPMPLVDPESSATYANYKTARIALYQDTVLPLMDHARDDFNGWLVPMFGDDIVLAYDPDSIEALQQDRANQWEMTDDVRLTIDERRVAIGLDPLPNGLGQVIVLGTGESVIPVEDLLDPPAQLAGDAPQEGSNAGKEGKSAPFASEMGEQWMLQTTAKRVQQITDTTRLLVRAAMEGNPDSPADAVRAAYAQMGQTRSALIARSEVITAANAGARFAALSTGLDLEKEWVADPAERHSGMDGQRRGMFEPYDVDGVRGMFPGDPNLPASHGANCRCMEIFHPSRKRVSLEARDIRYHQHGQYRSAWEGILEEDARRLFAAEGDTVAAHIAAAADSASAMQVLEALPQEPWQRLLRTAYTAVMDDFAQRTLGGLR